MVATVLSAKNGVITEDRFRKMSQMQWVFHFCEIKKSNKDEKKKIDHILDFIDDRLDILGMLVNPKLSAEFIKVKKENSEKDESGEDKISDKDKELLDYFNEIMDFAPETLEVEIDKKSEDKFFLPKRKRRKLGIDIKQDQDGD